MHDVMQINSKKTIVIGTEFPPIFNKYAQYLFLACTYFEAELPEAPAPPDKRDFSLVLDKEL